MSSALVTAVDVTVKYDTKFSTGQTRRERAARGGYESPAVIIPDHAQMLWRWFWQLRHTKRSQEHPIDYLDLQAWTNLSGNLILPCEYDIILAMDASFRSAAKVVAKQDEELMQRYKGKK